MEQLLVPLIGAVMFNRSNKGTGNINNVVCVWCVGEWERVRPPLYRP